MLHLFQIAFDQIQPINARLEFLCQLGEQWRQAGVFELIELGDDVITFLARFNEIDQILQALPPQAVVVDALGKHAGEKQRVIADVLPHLALAVKRWCRAINGVGFQQHLTDISQRTSASVAYLQQLLALAEFGQHVDDIVLNFGIAQSKIAVEMLVDQVGEQLLQGMGFGNHGVLLVSFARKPAQSTDVMRVLIALSSSSASLSCASSY
jgi:hypothetical protein